MDNTGTCRLVYDMDETRIVNEEPTKFTRSSYIDLGVVEDIAESFHKSTSSTPRTSMGAENTFVLENGCTMTLTVTFRRVCPHYSNDNVRNSVLVDSNGVVISEENEFVEADNECDETLFRVMRMNGSCRWSNNKWYRTIVSLVDRWQMRSDGFKFLYIPDQNGTGSENPYIPAYNYVNGYVKRLSMNYKAGNPQVIFGTLEFHVGTMYMNEGKEEPEDTLSDTNPDVSSLYSSSTPYASIWLTNDDENNRTQIYSIGTSSSDISYIDAQSDFTLEGGPNNPFECLSFTISRNALNSDGIYPRKGTIVSLTAFGDRTRTDTKNGEAITSEFTYGAMAPVEYTVQSVQIKSVSKYESRYVLCAYTKEYLLKDTLLKQDITGTVKDIIDNIIGGKYSQKLSEASDYLITNAEWPTYAITVTKGIDLWSLLKICAELAHAKVFFAQGHMYIIDYFKKVDDAKENAPVFNSLRCANNIRLNEGYLRQHSSGSTKECSSNASNSIYNYCTLGLSDTASIDAEEYSRMGSIRVYGVYEYKGSVDSHVSLNDEGYRAIRRYILDYFAYPQTPLQFTLKEIFTKSLSKDEDAKKVWLRIYPPATYAISVSDEQMGFKITCRPKVKYVFNKDGSITLKDSDNPIPGMLMMSQYSCNLLNCQTTYTFGEITESSLAQTLNNI